ncbi:MAG: class II glutamine amidotransferase [Faecalibacterium sp.]
MCELFGMSSARSRDLRELLTEFYSHSVRHPHGWGLALIYPNAVSLEKEPVSAVHSAYLRRRLDAPLWAQNCIAHIRLATRGALEYCNTHPFVQRDSAGRAWTLAHNGTIFSSPLLEPFREIQSGQTDSERILFELVARVNERQAALGRPLDAQERFSVCDAVVCSLAPENKLNLLFSDGELLYAHTNMRGTLYLHREPGCVLFATVPVGVPDWEPLTFTTLTAWSGGELRFTGTCHGKEYHCAQQDVQFLISDSAVL